MSRLVPRHEYAGYDSDFELGDRVSFIAPHGGRMTGTVVRVYNCRTAYHVEVDGQRYSCHPGEREDDMQREPS